MTGRPTKHGNNYIAPTNSKKVTRSGAVQFKREKKAQEETYELTYEDRRSANGAYDRASKKLIEATDSKKATESKTRISSKKQKDGERIYLDVPYDNRADAKVSGAKWDAENKKWYFNKDGETDLSDYQKELIEKWKIKPKIYLTVPFEYKDDAKERGARWDAENKRWYCYEEHKNLIETYKENSEPIERLDGEDRDFTPSESGLRLFIDLRPINPASSIKNVVHFKDWERLKKFIFERNNFKCECCLSKTEPEDIEAHEYYEYSAIGDAKNPTLTLKRIIAICKRCHEATHYGLAKIKQREHIAKAQLENINKIDEKQANKHIKEAFELWKERDRLEDCALNLELLTNNGIKIN
jgi:frataxin-like iron-binding protein CyaY